MNQEEQLAMATEQTYIPATSPAYSPFVLELRKLPFASRDRPDQICGVAHRVGYTGTRASDHALYRLKLKTSLASLKTAVLPGFFVLEQGLFVPYDLWRTCQGKETRS